MPNEDGTAKCCSVPSRLKPHIPSSRKVYIVLLWIVLTHCIYNYTIFNTGGILDVGSIETYPVYLIGATQLVALLIYPIAGIVGEVYWTRYKVLITGLVLMLFSLVASPLALVGLIFLANENERLSMSIGGIFIGVALIPFQIGLAMFESNIIQFGTNQLLFASSDQLSNFVHWSFWCMYFVPAVTTLISCFFNLSLITTGPIVELIAIIIALIIMLLPKTRKTLELRKFTRKNPINLVIGVLKYAKNNKYPAKQSAFTYNDEEKHNRINFAKKRYGGPFTTEEVEDVKTLGRITVLLSSMFGFLLIDNTGILVNVYSNLDLPRPSSVFETIALCAVDNFTITFLVIVVGVPIYKLILTPIFYKFLPNMIKRMGIGLAVTILSLLTQLALSVLQNNSFEELGYVDVCGRNLTNTSSLDNLILPPNPLPSQYMLIAPQILNGFSLLLIFLTALEFILAQAPRSMQGLLVGYWYALQSVNVLLSTFLFTTDAGCSYISYIVRAGLASLSLVSYIMAAYWYKGRARQESSLIKQNIIIQEYTARALLNQKIEELNTLPANDPYLIGTYDLSEFSIASQ